MTYFNLLKNVVFTFLFFNFNSVTFYDYFQFMIQWLQKCHAIEGYDASKCAEDCQKAETEDFAKNCTSGGGFFKCCIRYSAKIS
jgi:hypothetical protein